MSKYEQLRLNLREPRVLLPIYIVFAILAEWWIFEDAAPTHSPYMIYHALVFFLYFFGDIIAVKFIRRGKIVTALYIPILLNISVFVNNVFTQILIQEPNMAGFEAVVNILRNLHTYFFDVEFIAPLVISYLLLAVFIVIKLAGNRKKEKQN
ncbi:MAG: hypothetical protein LBM59_05630 [Ruminococcus sp.]|jgi:hypothetical protein|nr:hypothetical protein [Ruminococcus sp.]